MLFGGSLYHHLYTTIAAYLRVAAALFVVAACVSCLGARL
jgi:hypothetical protein